MAEEIEITKKELNKLNEIEFRAEKMFDAPTKIVVLGKKFKVKPLHRWVQNKVIDLCPITAEAENTTKKTRDNDVKAATYILLHNPIKIMLFGWIMTKIMKCKYNSEIFYAIIKTALNNDAEVFFSQSVSLLILGKHQRMMKI